MERSLRTSEMPVASERRRAGTGVKQQEEKARGTRIDGLLVCAPPECPRVALLEVLKALLCLIPPGLVTSYGEMARLLGIHPRLVGRLLASNDKPIAYPCHRVVKRDRSLGGYNGPGGTKLKEGLLRLEGVKVSRGRVDEEAFYDVAAILLERPR